MLVNKVLDCVCIFFNDCWERVFCGFLFLILGYVLVCFCLVVFVFL